MCWELPWSQTVQKLWVLRCIWSFPTSPHNLDTSISVTQKMKGLFDFAALIEAEDITVLQQMRNHLSLQSWAAATQSKLKLYVLQRFQNCLLFLSLMHLPCHHVKLSPCFSAAKSLKEVQVTHVLGWILGNSNLAIIENCPPPIFVYVSDIVATVRGGPHMAYYPDQPIFCNNMKENSTYWESQF